MNLLTNVITMLMNPMQQAFQLPCWVDRKHGLRIMDYGSNEL